MNAPKISIKNLVKNGWVPANTSTITPSFSTGWYDRKNVSPQITFTDPVEVPISSGTTGFFGIVTGGVPNQYWSGSIAVNIWVTREGLSVSGVNPKKCVFEVREEIKRIVQAGYESISDLDYVSWGGGFEEVNDKNIPVVYKFVGEINYGYLS